MDNNPIGELMQNTMESVKNILKVDTVVGDPIFTPDGITLVPISKISVGFGGGGIELTNKKAGEARPYGGGNATGAGAQVSGKSLDEACGELTTAIDKYFETE